MWRAYRTFTEVSGIGIEVVPNLPRCQVPVLRSYRTYRGVGYRHRAHTELTEVSGTGIEVVPNLPRCRVPVLRSYRGRTELTEVSGTGIEPAPNKYPYPGCTLVRTLPNAPFKIMSDLSGTTLSPNIRTVRIFIFGKKCPYSQYRVVQRKESDDAVASSCALTLRQGHVSLFSPTIVY